MSEVISMEEVLANSYKNFHSKGLDYICLHRSDEYTQKLYFFDGDVSTLPEVVNPHNHRYDFMTRCVSGAVENVTYGAPSIENWTRPTRYTLFSYATPLLGGTGFSNPREAQLVEISRSTYGPSVGQESYFSRYSTIHTIAIRKPETVLVLNQGPDLVEPNHLTNTYVRGDEAPSLDGLYEEMKADNVIAKLTKLAERVPSWDMPVFG